jgi:hypothetical protein
VSLLSLYGIKIPSLEFFLRLKILIQFPRARRLLLILAPSCNLSRIYHKMNGLGRILEDDAPPLSLPAKSTSAILETTTVFMFPLNIEFYSFILCF